jgi:site-specific DNA-cytosine methylase
MKRIADLFCGAGGTSTGILQACEELGHRADLLAVNHRPTAVNTHTLNHPGVRHLCETLENIRRVSDILARFKLLNLLNWKQNYLAGTTELGPSTYTLMSCTPCTRLGTPCTRLGAERFSENCTVVEQSPKESPEKSPLTRGSKSPRLENQEQWKLDKDKARLERQIREEREKSKPDQDIIAAWRSELKTINDELRRRGKSAKPVTAADDAPRRNDRNAGTYNANAPTPDLDAILAKRLAEAEKARAEQAANPPPPPRVALVEPFFIPKYSKNPAIGIDHPLPTQTTKDCVGLVEPFIVKYYGSKKAAESIHEPLDTVTTKDRFMLVEPKTGRAVAELDILFRMLQPHELAAAMSFPKGYQFTGNRGEQVKQIGNAVPVNLARACAKALFQN